MSAASVPDGHRRLPVELDTSLGTVLGATERLKLSRRLLREHMQALNAPTRDASATDHSSPSGWLAALAAIPVLGPTIQSVSAWWAQHPLRVVADLFTSSTTSTAKPMSQTRPWTVLLLAVAAGGLLVWARPWRYALLRRAVYTSLLPQLVSGLMSRLPIPAWLDIVNSLTRGPVAATPATPLTTQSSAEPVRAGELRAHSSPSEERGPTPNTALH